MTLAERRLPSRALQRGERLDSGVPESAEQEASRPGSNANGAASGLPKRLHVTHSASMDWTTIGAAAVGAAIGWLGELARRRGAQREAAKARVRAIEDHDRRAREQRSVDAAMAVLHAFQANKVDLLMTDNEAAPAAKQINAALYTNALHVQNADLRRRLVMASDILDLASFGRLPKNQARVALPQVVFILRNSLYLWIGETLRGDPISNPSTDWNQLEVLLKDGLRTWHSELHQRGHAIHPRTFDQY
jgi:hypothetical protein